MDRSQFDRTLAGVSATAKTWGASIAGNTASAMKGAISAAGKASIIGLGATAISAGVGLGGAIAKAADMETYKTQFATLLKSAGAAENRMKALAKFAATTPFELPEIAAASKTLETMAGSVLSVGNGLRMVGDIAAGSGMRFEEASMWVGRLYDGLQNNRPVGEALMRLSEVGVISGSVRGKIEALVAAGNGLKGWDIATEAFGRFGGSMDALSKTWSGKISSLKDAISGNLVEIGKPIINALKPVLGAFTIVMDNMVPKAKAFGEYLAAGIKTGLELFKSGTLFDFVQAKIIGALATAGNYALGIVTSTVEFLARSLFGGAIVPAVKMLADGLVASAMIWSGTMLKGLVPMRAEFADMLRKLADGMNWVSPLIGYGINKAADSMTATDPFGNSKLEKAANSMADTGRGMLTSVGKEFGDLITKLGDAFQDSKVNFKPSDAFGDIRTNADAQAALLWEQAAKNIPKSRPDSGQMFADTPQRRTSMNDAWEQSTGRHRNLDLTDGKAGGGLASLPDKTADSIAAVLEKYLSPLTANLIPSP